MIIDKLVNISKYDSIPAHVVDFVLNLSKNTNLGRRNLNNDDYANIESYQTKSVGAGKFEAHKNYIDIQILLDGCERIYYTGVEGLSVDEPYDESRDIVFYSDNISTSDFVTLDGSNFVMIFPHEAHAPQIALGDVSKSVKKVVVKLKV